MIDVTHDKSSLISRFRVTLSNIHDLISIIEQYVDRSTVLDAHTFPLPAVTKEDEKSRMLAHRQFLNGEKDFLEEPGYTVGHTTGKEAVVETFAHYHRLRVNPDQSSWYAHRLPGFICLHCDKAQELIDYISRLNHLKAELQALSVALAPDDYERRWELIHNAVPGFSSSAAFRPMLFMTHDSFTMPPQPTRGNRQRKYRTGQFDSLYSARFNFEHRNQIVTVPYDALIKRLNNAMTFGDSQRPGLSIQAEQELRYVQGLSPNTVFRQKRPMPAAQIYKIRGYRTGEEKLMLENGVAHSPVLLINLGTPEHIGHLPDYFGRTLSQPSDDDNLVIRRLHIYRKP